MQENSNTQAAELQNVVTEHYSISANNDQIIISSDQKTANAVRFALVVNNQFWDAVQSDIRNYPTVVTTIICKGKANLDNFLELQSIREAFLTASI